MGLGSKLGKVLIANRGEIACRVIRSAKQLGVKTVAVYSDADANSMHVSQADEAYYIGQPPAQDSYLKGEKIIEVAKKCNVNAIHPGYGFLSENVEFATQCKNANIVFVGPPASAIRDMGIKSTSKIIMTNAGVPVIPGYHGNDQSDDTLIKEAKKIGFPLMIKAVRGGGGKGMRIAHSEKEFLSALESARRESLKSFGDSDVLIEKYILKPRHIEVQVFGDSFGNYVHLFERDCSVQRRHQKVIEQAPGPGISESLRKELGEAGVQAAKAVGYVGAGTVEFVMDTETNLFYFMEMNTRLQVEHPVTEMITGIDLVEWQLRVASGEKLPLTQDEIKLKGHSVEARIYAEDVAAGFLPTAGCLHELLTPIGPGIRVETGVRRGDIVSVHYDPMIAKLVVWDSDPEGALDKLEKALSEFNIIGIENNVDFLRALSKNIDLRQGKVHTGFIEEHKKELLGRTPNEESIMQAAMGIVFNDILELAKNTSVTSDPFNPFISETSFRLNHIFSRVIKLKHQNEEHHVYILLEDDGSFLVQVDNNEKKKLKGSHLTKDGFMTLKIETSSNISSCKLFVKDNTVYIFSKNGDYKLQLVSELCINDDIENNKKSQAVSPMPGIVEKIFVKPGDFVKKGDPIAVVIAMKMEHVIKAEREGSVSSVMFRPGENVGKNVPLIVFDE